MGLVDSADELVDAARSSSAHGVRPSFMIYCYDEKGCCRLTQDCIGRPDSNNILQWVVQISSKASITSSVVWIHFLTRVIRSAIADPLPPLEPGLPWLFVVSRAFLPAVDGIRHFLNSLPSPFYWRVETAEEAHNVKEGTHDLKKEGFSTYINLAAQRKTEGNRAFTTRNRSTAVGAYQDAIE
jgi:hypothetical protein